jgi:hypothetical protein
MIGNQNSIPEIRKVVTLCMLTKEVEKIFVIYCGIPAPKRERESREEPPVN